MVLAIIVLILGILVLAASGWFKMTTHRFNGKDYKEVVVGQNDMEVTGCDGNNMCKVILSFNMDGSAFVGSINIKKPNGPITILYNKDKNEVVVKNWFIANKDMIFYSTLSTGILFFALGAFLLTKKNPPPKVGVQPPMLAD